MKYECKSCKVIKPYRDEQGKKTCNDKYICKECQNKSLEPKPNK